MYDRELYSRVVRFQRTAVDNGFAIYTTLQGYGDKILKKSLEQNPWLPEKSKSTCAGLYDSCLYGSKTLKKFIDQGFDEMERLVARGSGMPAKGEKSEAKPPLSRTAAATGQRQTSEKKSAASQKSTGKSASSTTTGSSVKSPKQSTAQPRATTPPSSSVATPVATPVTQPAAKPVSSPITPPAAPSTAPPSAATASAVKKPAESSEKTAQGMTTGGKSS